MAEGPAWDYLRWYHEQRIWKNLFYRGVRTLKFPSDMWNYQEIITEHEVHWVVETGTRHGGSALFFADLLRNLGRSGRVYTIDPTPQLQVDLASHETIHLVIGDSASPSVVDFVYGQLPDPRQPLFLILDSDHGAAHVLRELRAHVPRLRPGDYLVVEDTVVNGHPVRPEHGPGPMEALQQFLLERPGLLVADAARANKFGASMARDGYFKVVG